MDATEIELVRNINARIDQIDTRLVKMNDRLDELHSPADCAISDRVKVLELGEARKKGMLVVIGTVAGLVASVFIAWIQYLFRKGS